MDTTFRYFFGLFRFPTWLKKINWAGTWAGLLIIEKAANVQRKIVIDLQKAWMTITQDYFKNTRKSGSLEIKYTKMKYGSRVLHITVKIKKEYVKSTKYTK